MYLVFVISHPEENMTYIILHIPPLFGQNAPHVFMILFLFLRLPRLSFLHLDHPEIHRITRENCFLIIHRRPDNLEKY